MASTPAFTAMKITPKVSVGQDQVRRLGREHGESLLGRRLNFVFQRRVIAVQSAHLIADPQTEEDEEEEDEA